MELVPMEETADVKELVEVEFYNKSNPRSCYNLMPEAFRKRIEQAPALMDKYIEMEETELKSEIKMTPTLNRLRYSFWNEYYRVVGMSQGKMIRKNILSGVCSVEIFQRITSSPEQLAWILSPPSDTVLMLKETLNFGFDRIREILDLPLYKIESVKIGKDEFEDREVVDEKVANLMLKAVAMIDLRLHGGYVQVQKIEQKTTNTNMNLNVEGTTPINSPQQLDDIDAKLLELRTFVTTEAKKVEKPFTKDEIIDMDKRGLGVMNIPNTTTGGLRAAGRFDEADDL